MASILRDAGRPVPSTADQLNADDAPFGPDDTGSRSSHPNEATLPWPHGVPPNVDAMDPGPIVAAWLSAVDVDAVSGLDRVAVMRAHHRLATHFAALAYRDMLAIHDLIADEDAHGDPVDVGLATEAEIRAAMRWSRRFTESELRFALDLRDRHAAVFAALERGSIDVPRARAIDRGTCHLPHDVATRIGASLVDEAGDLTVGELLDRVRRLVIAVEPDEAEQRFAEAHDRRRVVLEPTVDGTANVLGMDLAPQDAAAVRRRIQRLAKHASVAGDQRNADQVRADVFVDLLLGRSSTAASSGTTSSAPRADLDIRVDLTTLMRLDDEPADVAGYGPVVADIARSLAEAARGARWTATVTDPTSRRPIVTSPVRRRPTTMQARIVRSTHPTCVFPGCRMPAVDCDLDHTRPWSTGGATDEQNLAPLCRHDHRIKTETGWTYTMGETGPTWHSRLGGVYQRGRPPP